MRLSFIINGISGFILLLVLLNFIFCRVPFPIFLQNGRFSYQTISLLLLASMAIGIHGISHAYEEIYYDYNPIRDGILVLPSDEKKLDKK